MPLIDAQRRIARVGAIRLGNRVPTKGVDRRGNPRTRPNKLDRFRITTPDRGVADAVARLHGGTVATWSSPTGPEWEVITDSRELPVLIPPQRIDPNYELWGNRVRERLCDGRTERLRSTGCLCRRWDNHQHRWWKGSCQICGVPQDWDGQPHQHVYESGVCQTCGCRRPCKPTTRVNVMIRDVPSVGVFKVESHGINAAQRLPGFADLIAATTIPLPARLVMEYQDRLVLVVKDGHETTETRQFWVPDIRFDWITPDMAYAGSAMLERAARAQLAGTQDEPRLAIQAAPVQREIQDIAARAAACQTIEEVRALWREASHAGHIDDETSRILTRRGTELAPVVDAEVIDDESWPPVNQPPTDKEST